MFLDRENKKLFVILVFGKGMCSHQDKAHGGAIAAVLDDALGTLAMLTSERDTFSANLNLNYKKPIPIQVIKNYYLVILKLKHFEKPILIRAKVEKIEGRKIMLQGTIEDESQSVYAGYFVSSLLKCKMYHCFPSWQKISDINHLYQMKCCNVTMLNPISVSKKMDALVIQMTKFPNVLR
jgi:hypothetical protein